MLYFTLSLMCDNCIYHFSNPTSNRFGLENHLQAFSSHEHSHKSLMNSSTLAHETHEDQHNHENDVHDHDHPHETVVVWRGVVILAVLALFFIVERLLNIFGEWRQRLQSNKQVHRCSISIFSCFPIPSMMFGLVGG